MVSSASFGELIQRLSRQVVEAPDQLEPSQRNEEWTKIVLILPLLEGLGWDRALDVGYEDQGKPEVEGALDFILMCQPSIGIEAKRLDVKPPQDRSHPQIEKGLKQSGERGAQYFIWTNGDCWQFYSLTLPDAPMYEVTLSSAHGGPEMIQYISAEFQIIDRDLIAADPTHFDEALRKRWKTMALPVVLDALVTEHKHDLVQLAKRALPSELDFEDEEILAFLQGLRSPGTPAVPVKKRQKQARREHSFPEDWQGLIDSFEPQYARARRRFRKGYYRKLGQYLIGDQYVPWSKSTTWRHVGTPNEPNEKKKLGPVVALFIEWHFMETVQGTTDKYQRVEAGLPYLRQILEESANL
jgi:hypothetical protein